MIYFDQVTQVDSSGNLILEDCFLTKKYRLTPWRKGIRIEEFEEGWQKKEEEIELVLFQSLDLAKNSPLQKYCEPIPDEILQIIRFFPHRQVALLSLISQSGAAFDLALCNPVLLWLLVGHYQKEGMNRQYIEKVLKKKQLEILQEIIPKAGNKELKLLSKIWGVSFTQLEEEAIFEFICQGKITKQLSHSSAIHLYFFRAWKVYRLPEELKALNIYLSGKQVFKMKHPVCISNYKEISHINKNESIHLESFFYYEIPRMKPLVDEIQRIAKRNEIKQQPNWGRLGSYDRLQKEHDRLLDILFEIEMKANKPFPSPLVKGTATIIPITSPRSLRAEGKEMANCVFSRMDYIYWSKTYVYKVTAPQRATLEIYSYAKPYIKECKLAGNREPSKETLKSIEEWLEGGAL
ncbi:MAG: hypothetical protein QNL04_10995 [SAR324 cluster bacterium]|nr:hypothetical protein [SAR324 cluster bacterium]